MNNIFRWAAVTFFGVSLVLIVGSAWTNYVETSDRFNFVSDDDGCNGNGCEQNWKWQIGFWEHRYKMTSPNGPKPQIDTDTHSCSDFYLPSDDAEQKKCYKLRCQVGRAMWALTVVFILMSMAAALLVKNEHLPPIATGGIVIALLLGGVLLTHMIHAKDKKLIALKDDDKSCWANYGFNMKDAYSNNNPSSSFQTGFYLIVTAFLLWLLGLGVMFVGGLCFGNDDSAAGDQEEKLLRYR